MNAIGLKDNMIHIRALFLDADAVTKEKLTFVFLACIFYDLRHLGVKVVIPLIGARQ